MIIDDDDNYIDNDNDNDNDDNDIDNALTGMMLVMAMLVLMMLVMVLAMMVALVLMMITSLTMISCLPSTPLKGLCSTMKRQLMSRSGLWLRKTRKFSNTIFLDQN